MIFVNKRKYFIISISIIFMLIAAFVILLKKPESLNNKNNVSKSDELLADNHFYKEFSDNFKVDVDLPDISNKTKDVIFAKLAGFDENIIKSIFFDGKEPEKKQYDDAFTLVTGDSTATIVQPFCFYYETEDLQSVKFPTENFTTKYEQSNYNMLPNYSDVYKLKNLDFMNRDDAVEYVISVLKKMGISVSEKVEIYAIDYKTMQDYQDSKKENDPDIASMYQIKDRFTKDDEFYILCLTTIINEIPVTHYTYHMSGGKRDIPGSNIKVYLSKKGIFNFDASGIYKAQNVAESPTNLITAEEAIEKAFYLYDSIVTTDKVTVTDICFEYGFVPYNKNYDEVKLTPTWTLTLSYENDENSIIRPCEIISINAVTGEQIN